MASPTKNTTIYKANSTKEGRSDRTEHSQTRNPFQVITGTEKSRPNPYKTTAKHQKMEIIAFLLMKSIPHKTNHDPEENCKHSISNSIKHCQTSIWGYEKIAELET